jgi:hypothetical protein
MPRTAGKINRQGMNLPAFMPGISGPKIIVTPIVDGKGPMRMLNTLEHRLGTTELMWFLQKYVSPFMADVIVDRFAYAGDASVGGPWPPLAEYTERLKRSLGAPPDAPNERSGEMMHHLAYDHDVEPWALGALIRIPGSSDQLMEKKIRVAQEGDSGGSNPFGGGGTPPRPVLGMGLHEEAGISKLFDAYLWTGLA